MLAGRGRSRGAPFLLRLDSGRSGYPREVVKVAIQHNAHSILIARNHPSGSS
ncbi:JAB domain-containing protein [Achromobacter marplatensis]|uniref:JAB domain-containing protein n=1 Tax=Achromobacter marplatensis TaxID=470868 RepID=UPI0036F254C4